MNSSSHCSLHPIHMCAIRMHSCHKEHGAHPPVLARIVLFMPPFLVVQCARQCSGFQHYRNNWRKREKGDRKGWEGARWNTHCSSMLIVVVGLLFWCWVQVIGVFAILTMFVEPRRVEWSGLLHAQAILFMQTSADKKDSLHTRHDPNATFPSRRCFVVAGLCLTPRPLFPVVTSR